MPNWSYNRLSVTGSAEAMKPFLSEAVKGGSFKMSNIFPMPEKIKNTISPSSAAKNVRWMNEDRRSANREGSISDILGEEPEGLIPCENNTDEKCRELIAEYGTDNWYDWNIQAYGTKWDFSADEEELDISETCLEASFDTAWSPPIAFLERLQARFPDIDISLLYELEGGDGCGRAYTDRSSGGPEISIEEAELEYRAEDGRDIFFDEDDSCWKYEGTDEECYDMISYNPLA
jgi:hypothetical protein